MLPAASVLEVVAIVAHATIVSVAACLGQVSLWAVLLTVIMTALLVWLVIVIRR